MSVLLNAHGQVLSNAYVEVADEAELPASGALVLSLARWQAEGAALAGREIGVRLANTVDVQTLDERVLQLPLIVLSFPGFADGRAYSQATLLRRRGYTGALRAQGAAVVADQLVMLRRCGISEFLLREDQNPETARRLLQQGDRAFYQPSAA